MYHLLRSKNHGLKENLVEFTRALIQTPSVSLEEKEAAALVEKKMRELGYDQVLRDDAGNVVGILFGREGAPALLLNSHLDTVAPETSAWSKAPYAAHREGDWIFGVGAADCKGGLAAQIFAGALLRRAQLPLQGNLIVAATVAEENGRSLGVRALLQETLPRLGMRPDFAILGEPTRLNLYYGHDGWMEMDVLIEGEDAFQVDDTARAIYCDLESGARHDAESEEEEGAEALLVGTPVFERGALSRRARVAVLRRLRATETAADVTRRVKRSLEVIAPAPGAVALDVRVREESHRLYNGRTMVAKTITPAWSTDPFHPFLDRARQAFLAAGLDTHPGKWRLERPGMGTAGGTFVNEFGVPAIGYGPGDEDHAHAPDERVSIGRLSDAVFGTAVLAHAIAGVPIFGWTSDEI